MSHKFNIFTTPLSVKSATGHRVAVDQYRAWLEDQPDLMATIKQELHGYDLICSCPLEWPCHADVLLEVTNRESENRENFPPFF